MTDRLEEAQGYFTRFFAPWIVDLGLQARSFDETGGLFVLPENPRLVHGGGVICGQATSSAADTCMVVTLAVLNGRFRMCTTVDLSTHFVRALKPGAVDIRVDLLSNGRRMAYGRIDMRQAGDSRVAVTATTSVMYLED
ncbi:MAG: PaaI family thioesterase [Rhizobiaceae bacterium]|nr:PaaI family thioesterase [Rhizobiaceae bacterium]MCV0409154.1 PaaI family thioesterase [Rhizobiaceae bacterium]